MSRIFLDTNIVVNDFLHRHPEYPKIKDIEDALQYTVCHDNRCYFLLTLNTKDFVEFADISAFHPSKCRFIDF
ncbi:MAG: hypothetical protein U5L45_09065 [Saprospiraceae bacterium]|nr:hypothetical protein [Saprospiraceae bacterium]